MDQIDMLWLGRHWPRFEDNFTMKKRTKIVSDDLKVLATVVLLSKAIDPYQFLSQVF
jgi:hypothetical protein